MKQETINIGRMTCNHCVIAVRKELAKLEALEVDDVNVGSAVVTYDEDSVTRADIEKAITDAGYLPLEEGQTHADGNLTQIKL